MIDTIHVTTISNCATGNISQTEYWNMKMNNSQYYGYWHNENDVQSYVALKQNGFVLVSL